MSVDGAVKPRWIILCATQRCGSTLICEDLRNNSLGHAEEHFIPFVQDKAGVSPAAEMLAAIERRSQSPNGIASVKIMANYISSIASIIAPESSKSTSAALFEAVAETYKNAQWVYVSRRSTVRQAISRILSKKRGINHLLATPDAPFQPGRSAVAKPDTELARAAVELHEIDEECLNIIRENETWERFFYENHLHPIRIQYENIVDNVEYLIPIAAGVGLTGLTLNGNRSLVVLSDSTNESAYARFMSPGG